MFFVYRLIIFWLIWFLFADKKRWRELFSVAIFAALLGQLSDNAFMDFYKLWDYQEPHGSMGKKLEKFFEHVLNDVSVYVVVVYLFIQWLPKKQSFWNLFKYWFIWTAIAFVVEWIHIKTGHMSYYHWWDIGYSYLSDWVLFSLFYMFHKVFRLKLLSEGQEIEGK
jgi:hypothetical protein